jgi:hypothetical protein
MRVERESKAMKFDYELKVLEGWWLDSQSAAALDVLQNHEDILISYLKAPIQ